MHRELADAVARGHAATAARVGARPTDAKALGFHVERLYARATGGACWAMLPRKTRRLLHGGGADVATADRGVDVVGIEEQRLVLVQLKWYDGGSVGSAAISKLVCIAECAHAATRLPLEPRAVLVVRAGTRVPTTAPGMSRVDVVALTDAEMFADPEREFLVDAPSASRNASRVAKFDDFQRPVIARALELARVQPLVRIKLPVGTGKSAVIAALARTMLARGPVVVVAPRCDIVTQLAETVGSDATVVGGGKPWPPTVRGLVVTTGQSVPRDLARCRVAAVIIYEAHSHEGRAATERAFETDVTFELSACLSGVVDIEEQHARAVELGLICDAAFVFDVFAAAPTGADLAAHLDRHPEHASVLACFQTCLAARRFAAECNAMRGGSARTYVGDDDRAELLAFASGDVRVLCVVGRVEMGINIHRCDTVLLAEPWDSANRTLQLIGRGVRLFPTKPGFFSVLCAVCPADLASRLESLVHALHAECPSFGIDRIEVRAAAEPADAGSTKEAVAEAAAEAVAEAVGKAVAEAVEAVERKVFDALGTISSTEEYQTRLAVSAYAVAVARVHPARLPSSRAYHAWRESQPARIELPDDPAARFKALPGGFSWEAFLRLDPLPARFGRALARACDDAVAKGTVHPSSFARPDAALYAAIRKTRRGAKLPEWPLRANATWPELFALK